MLNIIISVDDRMTPKVIYHVFTRLVLMENFKQMFIVNLMVENAMSKGLSGGKKGASNHNVWHNFSLRRHAIQNFYMKEDTEHIDF